MFIILKNGWMTADYISLMKMTRVMICQSTSCFLPRPLEGEAARVDFTAWDERGARAGNDGKKNFFPFSSLPSLQHKRSRATGNKADLAGRLTQLL